MARNPAQSPTIELQASHPQSCVVFNSGPDQSTRVNPRPNEHESGRASRLAQDMNFPAMHPPDTKFTIS